MNNTIQPDLSLVFDALTVAADHLAQYRRYSEEMRASGRGMSPSSPYSEDSAARLIISALNELKLTPRNWSQVEYAKNAERELNATIAR